MKIADTYDGVMLALTVWREARGESLEAKRGVAHVILNRMDDPRWPDTVAAVVTQSRQFSCFNAGDPNAIKFPTQKQAADWAAWVECCEVAGDALLGGYDPTKRANHYESVEDSSKRPAWADAEKMTLITGMIRFYRL